MSRHALLLLVGGRQVPNLLTAQYLQPDSIVPIASHESLKPGDAWDRIYPVLAQLCPEGLDEPIPVDAFNPEHVRTACQTALRRYPDAHWVFNITCATTIMSIGAYETGKEHNVSVWYLDTATRQVVTLSGVPPHDMNKLYHLNVTDYMSAYKRHISDAEPSSAPSLPQITFAQMLAQQPEAAMAFRDTLRSAGANKGKADQPRTMTLTNVPDTFIAFCQMAHTAGMVSQLVPRTPDQLICEMPSNQLWQFLDGQWLEVFCWDAARIEACFDDYRYGLLIPGDHGLNELDLALTYAATLLIAECKTETQPFKTVYLDRLRAIASMVGGNFVGRIFVTSQRSDHLDPQQRRAYDLFCKQAQERHVVVVTGERFGELGAMLRKEAERPTYFRG
jgi:hypothetical protein